MSALMTPYLSSSPNGFFVSTKHTSSVLLNLESRSLRRRVTNGTKVTRVETTILKCTDLCPNSVFYFVRRVRVWKRTKSCSGSIF